MANQFHIYFYFPNENVGIDFLEEGEKNLEEVRFLIDLADCEKDTQLYYDCTNFNSFIESLKTAESFDEIGQFGVADAETAIFQLFYTSNVIAIDNENINKELFVLWDGHQRSIELDIPLVLKVIAKKSESIQKSIQYPRAKHLFLNIKDAFPFKRKLIPVIKDNMTDADSSFPLFVKIEKVKDFCGLDLWLQKNRTARKYNYGDNRHVEGHPNYDSGRKKSPIIGGEGGKKHLEALLKSAIGDSKQAKKNLINYDETNNCYVRYEDENALNQYHGYHLVKPNIHERDKDAEQSILPRIKYLLEYRSKNQ